MAVQVSFIFRWNAYYSSCSQPKPILTRDFFFKKETLAEVNFYLSEESSSEDCIITANIAKQECSPFLKIIPLGTEVKYYLVIKFKFYFSLNWNSLMRLQYVCVLMLDLKWLYVSSFYKIFL